VFAIGNLAIKEIIEYDSLTTVPMMPACIRGVINLRGAVVPVIDLSARFGRPPTNVTKRTCIVIVEIETAGARGQLDELGNQPIAKQGKGLAILRIGHVASPVRKKTQRYAGRGGGSGPYA